MPYKTTIVTIADKNFFLAVFILVLSLRFHSVRANINILGIGLSPQDKKYLEQFANVTVFDGEDNPRNPTTRKGEAILTAEHDSSEYIALFDADCIVTGDISKYIAPPEPAWYLLQRTPQREAEDFRDRYTSQDRIGGIPHKIKQVWMEDVGELTSCQIQNTFAGGNIVLHKQYLDFAKKWHRQMLKVLPPLDNGCTHDMSNFAYIGLDEFVLNSLLAFSKVRPPLRDMLLNKDPSAYLAHLGPWPRYWVVWPRNKLQYYKPLIALISWAKTKKYNIPPLPWTLRKRNESLTFLVAYLYSGFTATKALLRKVPLLLTFYKAFRSLNFRIS